MRENRLRKAGIAGRVQMAIQLKLLDAEVLGLSAVLAVRTLQLEMEHVYRLVGYVGFTSGKPGCLLYHESYMGWCSWLV